MTFKSLLTTKSYCIDRNSGFSVVHIGRCLGMSDFFSGEPLLDMYLFETEQLLEQLEQLMLDNEKTEAFGKETINEVFRIMHTIKGSSAMMAFNAVSSLAHSMEDLFSAMRSGGLSGLDGSYVADLVFKCIDFIKQEINKAKTGEYAEGDPSALILEINEYLNALQSGFVNSLSMGVRAESGINAENGTSTDGLSMLKHAYRAVLHFEDGCEMESIRAYAVVHHLKDVATDIWHMPANLTDNRTSEEIRKNGFLVAFRSDLDYAAIQEILMQTLFLRDLSLTELDGPMFEQLIQGKVHLNESAESLSNDVRKDENAAKAEQHLTSGRKNILSVDVSKLDKLMDLVGEMVIAEAMVVQNPDLAGMELDNFQKAAQRLDKITREIQDMVMSVRMVSLAPVFQKMKRIVRDMCKKLGKEARLVIAGEDTEVDKNIIEHISDPLIHMVRNAIDHGIEPPRERVALGKDRCGTVTLEARSAGSDVLIIVRDDGRGLDKARILQKAREKGMLYKPESEMSDREIFNLILQPGFSTNDSITEYSGRGVGMDVVAGNIEAIGGSVILESMRGSGTSITLKIPLTLAIVDGMNLRVGRSLFTLPTISIRESFRPKPEDIFTDPEGNEMIMVRGEIYPILRLHRYFKIPAGISDFAEGIIIVAEHDEKRICLFADELLGQQQIVVKTLPKYIRDFRKVKGLAGCTLLGDGNISLILDVGGLIND